MSRGDDVMVLGVQPSSMWVLASCDALPVAAVMGIQISIHACMISMSRDRGVMLGVFITMYSSFVNHRQSGQPASLMPGHVDC
jgi:hypothetical protein